MGLVGGAGRWTDLESVLTWTPLHVWSHFRSAWREGRTWWVPLVPSLGAQLAELWLQQGEGPCEWDTLPWQQN